MLCWSKHSIAPEARFRERLARAREAVAVQALEIHALLEIHLRDARRLQRPVPLVHRLQVVRHRPGKTSACLSSWPRNFLLGP